MNLPNAVTSDSIQLDAKGKDVLLECYADGEILFWTDDGICLEFDRKNASLIIAALRRQEKLPKTSRASTADLLPFQRSPRLLTTPGINAASQPHQVKHKEPNRAVFKEALGWGATVILGGNAVRYYYDKRDNARAAMPAHKVGDSGRVA
ncbi:MAG: hypothetical protein PHQ05_03525 [Sterolibacterium sp.]|nr:hypothetical protein [Sterolibacterium sp.]